MRSLFAILAASWFAYSAVTFLPAMGVYLNDGAPGGLDGDPAGLAITYAARALFTGLTLLSLAIVEWGRIARPFVDALRQASPDQVAGAARPERAAPELNRP